MAAQNVYVFADEMTKIYVKSYLIFAHKIKQYFAAILLLSKALRIEYIL
jgi:hypothetical protein